MSRAVLARFCHGEKTTAKANVFAKGKQQAVFSVTRNYFRNGKQLARKGGGKHLRSRRFSTGGYATNESQFSATGEATASP